MILPPLLPAPLLPPDPRAPARPPADAAAAAEALEALFVEQMLAPMFEGLGAGGPFGAAAGGDAFRSLLLAEFGKLVARRGGLGLAPAIERKLLALQETA